MANTFCPGHVEMAERQARLEQRQENLEKLLKTVAKDITQLVESNKQLALTLERHTALMEIYADNYVAHDKQLSKISKRLNHMESACEGNADVYDTKRMIMVSGGSASVVVAFLEILKKVVALLHF